MLRTFLELHQRLWSVPLHLCPLCTGLLLCRTALLVPLRNFSLVPYPSFRRPHWSPHHGVIPMCLLPWALLLRSPIASARPAPPATLALHSLVGYVSICRHCRPFVARQSISRQIHVAIFSHIYVEWVATGIHPLLASYDRVECRNVNARHNVPKLDALCQHGRCFWSRPTPTVAAVLILPQAN